MSEQSLALPLPARPAVNPWFIAVTVMVATFMEVLDTSIANVALPHIAGSLSAGVDESTWVLTSYLVSNAVVLPLTGWFSTLFGRKRFYMSCVVIFTVSSFLCGLAPNLATLVFFRILQGAGGGGLQPVSQAILVESFPVERRGFAMAIYGMGVVVAPIIGPTLGGWITDNYSWRWIFLINIPVGVLALLMTSALVTDPPYQLRTGFRPGLRIDYIGLGLLSVGLGMMQFVLDKGERDDWFGSDLIVWCTVVAAISLIAAIFWELRQPDPIVDLRLFKDRNFSMGVFSMFSLGVILYGTTVLLPILVQTLMGYTAQLSGLVLSPGAVATMITLPLVGALLARFEARWLVVFGLVSLSVGMFSLSRLNLQTDFGTFVRVWIMSRAGLGFLFVPINVMAFSFVAREKMNNASGLINLARNIGGSMGISMVITLQDRLAQVHQTALVRSLGDPNLRLQSWLGKLAAVFQSQGAGAADAAARAHGVVYSNLLRQAGMLAFTDVFRMMGFLCLALVPLMFFMKKTAPGKAPAGVH